MSLFNLRPSPEFAIKLTLSEKCRSILGFKSSF